MSEVRGYYLHSIRNHEDIFKVEHSLSLSRAFNHAFGGTTEKISPMINPSSQRDMQELTSLIHRSDQAEWPIADMIIADSLSYEMDFEGDQSLEESVRSGRARAQWIYSEAEKANMLQDTDGQNNRIEFIGYTAYQIYNFHKDSAPISDMQMIMITRQLMIDGGFDRENIYIAEITPDQPQNGRSTYALVMKVNGGADQIVSPVQSLPSKEYAGESTTRSLDDIKYFKIGNRTNGQDANAPVQTISSIKTRTGTRFSMS